MTTVPLETLPKTLGRTGELRWRVVSAEDGRTSPSWKLWRRGDDLYMCQRSMKELKVSLHKSGSFSTSLISDEVAESTLGRDRSRHLDIWAQPPAFAPGWTLLAEVVHPDRELGEFTEDGIHETECVDLPIGAGHAVHVSVFLSSPTVIQTTMNFSECIHMATARMTDWAVHVMAIVRPWGENEMAIADAARQRTPGASDRSVVISKGKFDRGSVSARLLTSSLQPDGRRCFIDLAAVSPPTTRP